MSFSDGSNNDDEKQNPKLDKYVVDPAKFLEGNDANQNDTGQIGSIRSDAKKLEGSGNFFSIPSEDKRSGEDRRKGADRRSKGDRRQRKKFVLFNRRNSERRADEDRRTGIDRRLFNVFEFSNAGINKQAVSVDTEEKLAVRDQSGLILANTYIKDFGKGKTKAIEIFKGEEKDILLRLLDMEHIAIQRVSRTKYQITPEGIEDNFLYILSEKDFSLYLGRSLKGRVFVPATEEQKEDNQHQIKITLFVGEHIESVDEISVISETCIKLGRFEIEVENSNSHLLQIDREGGEPLVITGEDGKTNLENFKKEVGE